LRTPNINVGQPHPLRSNSEVDEGLEAKEQEEKKEASLLHAEVEMLKRTLNELRGSATPSPAKAPRSHETNVIAAVTAAASDASDRARASAAAAEAACTEAASLRTRLKASERREAEAEKLIAAAFEMFQRMRGGAGGPMV